MLCHLWVMDTAYTESGRIRRCLQISVRYFVISVVFCHLATRVHEHIGCVQQLLNQRQLHLQLQLHFAPRCALAGELLLSVATKVAKNALYRRQLFEVLVGGVRGLGVRYRASFRDLFVRAACSSSAYGRRADSGFDDYRSGVASMVPAPFDGGC